MSVHTGRSSSVYAGIPWGDAGKEGGGWLVTISARVVCFAREKRRIELMLIKDIFLQHHWLHCLKVCRFARCIRNRLSALVA